MRLQHLQNQFESAVLTAQKTPVSRNPWIYPQTVVRRLNAADLSNNKTF